MTAITFCAFKSEVVVAIGQSSEPKLSHVDSRKKTDLSFISGLVQH